MTDNNTGPQLSGGPSKNNTEGGKPDDFELFLSSEEDPDSQSEGEEQVPNSKSFNPNNRPPVKKIPERNPSESDSMSGDSPRSSSDEEDFDKTGQKQPGQFDKNNNIPQINTKPNFPQQQNPSQTQPQNFGQANKDMQQQPRQVQQQPPQVQGQPQQSMPNFNQMRPQNVPGQPQSMPNYQQMMQQRPQQQSPAYQQQLLQQQRMQQQMQQQGQPPFQGGTPQHQQYLQQLQQQRYLQQQQQLQRQQQQQNPAYQNMNNPMNRNEAQSQYGMPQNRPGPPNYGQQRPTGAPGSNWQNPTNTSPESKDNAAGNSAAGKDTQQSFTHNPHGPNQQEVKAGVHPGNLLNKPVAQGGQVDQSGQQATPAYPNQIGGQHVDESKRKLPEGVNHPQQMQPGQQEDLEAKKRRLMAGGMSPYPSSGLYDSAPENWGPKGGQPNAHTQPKAPNTPSKTAVYSQQYGRSHPPSQAEEDESASMDNFSDDQGLAGSPGGSSKPCVLCDKAFEGKSARTMRIGHMVSHFKDKLYTDLKEQAPPFNCPVTECSYQAKNKNGWACHYGSVHGLLKKYEQQYMQQNNLRDTSSPDLPKPDVNAANGQQHSMPNAPGQYGQSSVNPQLIPKSQVGYTNPGASSNVNNGMAGNVKQPAAWNPSTAPQASWNNVPGGKPPGWNNSAPFEPRNPRVPQTPMKGSAPWNTAPQTPAGKPAGFTVPPVPVKTERSAAPTVATTTPPTTAPQVQPQATPTPTATTSNMQEATVYKLTMPGSNLEGEQFFVELQAYANLREERDRLNQTVSTVKEEKDRLSTANQQQQQALLANKSSGSPEGNANTVILDSLKDALATKKEGEDPNKKAFMVAQDIVKQNKCHPTIIELSRQILLREEEKNSAKVDAGWMISMREKIQELEEQKKHLEGNNSSVKQAYANLTNESREKLETALNEVEKANQVEKSMFKKIQQLEENNRQLQDVTNTIKHANDDMSNKSVDSRQKLEIALQEVTSANEKEKIFSLKLGKLEEANRELKAMHASVKQANIELNAESREKLEIALNEVKKANAIEKALKREKKEFELQIDQNNQIINQLKQETNNYRHRYQNVDEKINQLHEENKALQERLHDSDNGGQMREKYQEIIAAGQKRVAEISQLKMVNERISRENEMWSKKIEKAEESNNKNEKLENALEEAKKANAANKLHLKGMAEKIQKLTGINKQLQEINASVKKENSDLSIKNKEELETKLTDAKKETEESRNNLKSMTEKTLKLTESCKELQKINASVKQANADLIVKSKEKLEIALNEVKKANADQKAMAEKVSELEDSNKQLQEFAKRLKAQKPSGDTKKELETSKKVVSSLNEQLSNMRKKIIDQSGKIKELEKDNEKVVEEMENVSNYKKKYQDVMDQNKNKTGEISQLKLTIDRISRENTKWSEEMKDKDGKTTDRKAHDTIKNYEQQIIALQKKCMETKEELKSREKTYLETLAKKEMENKSQRGHSKSGSTDAFEESDVKQENSELKKLVKHLESLAGKNVKDDGSKDGKDGGKTEAKMKHLMETVARKDRELANAKVETAKFQALMKKDLEKIKKMSLQYAPNPNNDKKIKDQQLKIDEGNRNFEALQKENAKYKMKLKTLMIEGQKVRGESKSSTPAPEEKSPEKKVLSDVKREIRTVRPLKKRRLSEEMPTEKMDVNSSEDKSNSDTSPTEEETSRSSDERSDERVKSKGDAVSAEDKLKDKHEGKLSESKNKSSSHSMEEELKNKELERKAIEDKLKMKTVNISPKTIKLVKLEKLTTQESLAKTNQIESELKSKAANVEEAKKTTLVKRVSSKDRENMKEDKGKSHTNDTDKSDETEDGDGEKPSTRPSRTTMQGRKSDKPMKELRKNVPVLRKSGRLQVKAEEEKDTDKKEDGETDKDEVKKVKVKDEKVKIKKEKVDGSEKDPKKELVKSSGTELSTTA